MPNEQQCAACYDINKSKEAYQNVEAYLADLVDLMREDVAELIRLGCRYIQFDAPQYAALLDPTLRVGYEQRGIDPDRILDLAIERDDAIIAGFLSSDVLFALHICRGNPAANSMPREATTQSLARCSAACATTGSCWSTTMPAPVPSNL